MGLAPQSDFELYWSTVLYTFQKDFITAKYGEPNFDKLEQIHLMVNIFNKSIQENCSHSQRQCIGESVIKFKGCNGMKQYMPLKPIKRGYKVWARCESSSGYLHQFDIYVDPPHRQKRDLVITW